MTRALKEIKHYQKITDQLIPKLPFCRLVKSVLYTLTKEGYRFQKAAIDCIQEAAEAYIVFILSEANLCAIHGKRVTVMPKDLLLLRSLGIIQS
jgi:histone H3/H4